MCSACAYVCDYDMLCSLHFRLELLVVEWALQASNLKGNLMSIEIFDFLLY